MQGGVGMNREEHVGESGIIVIKQRKELEMDGIEDILSFDENNVYLKTQLGNLSIDGEELHITALSLEEGKISLTGRILGLYYESDVSKKKSGLFGRKN